MLLTLLVACLLPGQRSFAAAPCVDGEVHVVVSGDDVASRDLQARLAGDSRPLVDANLCPVVAVAIEAVARGWLVRVDDVDGRRSERLVGDMDTAAAWVETWLLSAAEPLPKVAKSEARDARESSIGGAGSSASVSEPLAADGGALWAPQFQIAAFVEGAASDGKGAGGGIRARACRQFGPVCIGGGLRLAYSNSQDGKFDQPELHQLNTGLAATVDYGFRIGPLRLVAGGALGLLWRHEAMAGISWVPARGTLGPEFGASLRAHFPLGGAWSLSGGIFASVAPFNNDMYGDGLSDSVPMPPPNADGTDPPRGSYSSTPWSAGIGIGIHFAGGSIP